MLFNSIEFAVFIAIVLPLYWRLGHKWQNRMLLAASYVFYGWWDWRFLSLIALSTCLDYYFGKGIYAEKTDAGRRKYITYSVVVNLVILGFFKYFNFFVSSAEAMLTAAGLKASLFHLDIVLPVGISFYTFQSISYIVDIYRKEIKPAHSLMDFALYVSYFPQLVAGPIERAKHLLPQVLNKRVFNADQFSEGCFLIFWGLFKKVFIADNLAKMAARGFDGFAGASGFEVIMGVYAFAFQIYCDFSGYSDIARGLGKTMGFDIMVNFNLPYISRNPSEFWKRWHISLSSWLRDYLYIPLGGNRRGTLTTYRNLTLTMLLGGLWHGASWTFVAWGLYHGILLSVHRMIKPFLDSIKVIRQGAGAAVFAVLSVLVMFNLTCIGWLLFRSEKMSGAAGMLEKIFTQFGEVKTGALIEFFSYTGILLFVQALQAVSGDLMYMYRQNKAVKWAFYYACLAFASIFGVLNSGQFIYFQF